MVPSLKLKLYNAGISGILQYRTDRIFASVWTLKEHQNFFALTYKIQGAAPTNLAAHK